MSVRRALREKKKGRACCKLHRHGQRHYVMYGSSALYAKEREGNGLEIHAVPAISTLMKSSVRTAQVNDAAP